MTISDNMQTTIRRKYAHFQRLMTSLMWEYLTGKDSSIPGVNTVWLQKDKDGEFIKHVLHNPDSSLVDGKPIYNIYAKALYMVEDSGLLPTIEACLEGLEKVSNEAKAIANIPGSKHLNLPKLYKNITEVRFWRKQLSDSHKRSKAQIIDLLEREIKDKVTVTRQKYEHGTVDQVLSDRYAYIDYLQAKLEVIRHLEIEDFRERRHYEAVQVHLYDTQNQAQQLFVPDVGLILYGETIAVIDMDQHPRKRRAYRDGKKATPVAALNELDIYIEKEWQEHKIDP
jgi:hypothetical protein